MYTLTVRLLLLGLLVLIVVAIPGGRSGRPAGLAGVPSRGRQHAGLA